MTENRNGNGKPKTTTTRKSSKEIIAELKQKNKELEERNAALEKNIDGIVKQRTAERIIEKERYITRVENECDDRVANMRLVQNGLNANIERANKRIVELEKELAVERKKNNSIWRKLFGEKI